VEQLAVRLKRRLAEMGAQRPAVIYGGTVTADNAGRFAAIGALDGVGATRAALGDDGLLAIAQSVARAGAARGGD
jgi:triosephosphate isomerase